MFLHHKISSIVVTQILILLTRLNIQDIYGKLHSLTSEKFHHHHHTFIP